MWRLGDLSCPGLDVSMEQTEFLELQLASVGNTFYKHAEYDFVEYINLVIIYIHVEYIRNTYGTYVLIRVKKRRKYAHHGKVEVSMSKDFAAIIKPNILYEYYFLPLLVLRREDDLLLGVVDEPMSTSCFSQPTSFCPKPLGGVVCHPVGPALGNSLMETGKGRPCPTPLRRLIRAPEPPGSVSAKKPREVFVAEDVSPSCFFNSSPVARNPLVGRPVKSILPHIVKGQQSGTRQKKGKSSLHTRTV